MRGAGRFIAMSVGLLAASAGLYLLQVAIFHRPEETEFYLLQDIAFIPAQVLLVTLIVGRLLTLHEKRSLLNKMNMVIGAFYAEVGTELLRRLVALDTNANAIRAGLTIQTDWAPRQFAEACDLTRGHAARIAVSSDDLEDLQRYLLAKRTFMLRLLENPNLLEHNDFTDCLWAVFHLTDELAHRKEVKVLPGTDLRHLTVDMDRAYKHLMIEWLAYMKHLQKDYPYLFSLALRTNPFDLSARVEVR